MSAPARTAPVVLVVEDETAIRDVVSTALHHHGYTVRQESDGRAGIAAALGEAPDLIVLDVMLPKMDGYAVCRSLRDEDSSRRCSFSRPAPRRPTGSRGS